MNHRFFFSAALLLYATSLLNLEALQRTKEDILKDANQTQTEVDGIIAKMTAKGYQGLTATLAEIRRNISQVVGQLSKETDEGTITSLEMLYLRLKNKVFYEKLSAENDIHQVDLLEKKASVLLEKLNASIKALESYNQSQEAEELRIDLQQLKLFNTILLKEKTKRPLRYVQLLLSALEGKVLRKLNSVDLELKRLKKSSTTRTITTKTTTKTSTVKATTAATTQSATTKKK